MAEYLGVILAFVFGSWFGVLSCCAIMGGSWTTTIDNLVAFCKRMAELEGGHRVR